MNSDWAAENLQTIRTLMERSALYRRALAPTTLVAGVLGTLGAVTGWWWATESAVQFCIHWLVVAVLTLAACFLVMRRQALRASETFWSPPTRRVAEAMLPLLVFGLVLGVAMILADADDDYLLLIVLVWIGIYGGALHAAGFFMPRGIRLFGWCLIVGASAALMGLVIVQPDARGPELANAVMGVAFGLMHLGYGGYLLASEKRRSAT
jgi:hypothetical protein